MNILGPKIEVAVAMDGNFSAVHSLGGTQRTGGQGVVSASRADIDMKATPSGHGLVKV